MNETFKLRFISKNEVSKDASFTYKLRTQFDNTFESNSCVTLLFDIVFEDPSTISIEDKDEMKIEICSDEIFSQEW